MQTLTYEVKFMNLSAIPEIVATLDKCGLDCLVSYPSLTKGKIEIRPREENLTMDDVLCVGALIGQVETMSIM